MIAQRMILFGNHLMAFASLLAFALSLRPSELLAVLARHVVRPSHRSGAWTLILHPRELLVPSKTGVYDETVMLDNPQFSFLSKGLERL